MTQDDIRLHALTLALEFGRGQDAAKIAQMASCIEALVVRATAPEATAAPAPAASAPAPVLVPAQKGWTPEKRAAQAEKMRQKWAAVRRNGSTAHL